MSPLRRPAPPRLEIEEHEVHLWLATPPAEEDIGALLATLDRGERARASRFHFTEDRDLFVLAHAALRDVLSRYLRLPGADLLFTRDPRGKPALRPSCLAGSPDLRFSLSHSAEVAICAVSRGCEVGVDVERVRPDLVGPGLRPGTFFEAWTRREAVAKATGRGLEGPDPDPLRKRTSVRGFTPVPGYAAAVAVLGGAPRTLLRRWSAPTPALAVGRPLLLLLRWAAPYFCSCGGPPLTLVGSRRPRW